MSEWAKFKHVMDTLSFDMFHQKEITWYRLVNSLDPHGEKNTLTDYQPQTLKCLLSYNVMRTYPIGSDTKAGTIDTQHITVILNKQYLDDNGFLNPDGYFNFNPGNDYFMVDGIKYYDSGDTQASQVSTDNLSFFVVLKRAEYPTGRHIHGEPPIPE